MKRVLLAVVVASALVALAGATGGSGGGGYRVRTIFDNAANVVSEEDVKVAGANIGKVDSVDVTRDKKAVITLRITEPGFSPFRTDARCAIRQQSLIGEKFVECSPGSSDRPPLPRIPDGLPGAGDHLLPLSHTSSPVDIDLVLDTLRLPFRQRLALTINTLGTGLAGRGQDLNETIHRANPALRQTDRVLAILAAQNRQIARLARQANIIVAPLARRRLEAGHLVDAAATTSAATAEQSANLARSVQLLPAFLSQLRPTLQSLGAFSNDLTPVVTDLGTSAPDLNTFVKQLGPFSRAGTKSLVSLGKATRTGLPALLASEPTLKQLATLAGNARPVAANLDALTSSLSRSGGVSSALDFLFYQAVALNGFDSVSHYLRAQLITNLCSEYALSPTPGCDANFTRASAARAAAARRPRTGGSGSGAQTARDRAAALRSLADPKLAALRNAGLASQRSGPSGAQSAVLDYLLGSASP